MKLNPSKCAFGVTARKFLGFMVLQRGIKPNPDKISRDGTLKECKRSTKPQLQNSNAEHVRVKGNG